MSFSRWLEEYVGISWAYYDNNYSGSQAAELWEEYQEFLDNQEEEKMNKIKIVYENNQSDEYTIENKFLADELKAIQEEKTIIAAFLNGEKIK